MKTPYKDATAKQVEAYELVYLRGLKQVEAATLLGIQQGSVSKLIKRLMAKYPKLWKPRYSL